MNNKKFKVLPFQQQQKIRGGDRCDNFCQCYYKKTATVCDKAAATARHSDLAIEQDLCSPGGGGGAGTCGWARWDNTVLGY